MACAAAWEWTSDLRVSDTKTWRLMVFNLEWMRMRLKLDTSKSSTVFCRRFFAGGAGPNVGWKDGFPKAGFFSHGLGLCGVGPGLVSWISVMRRKHKPQLSLQLCQYAIPGVVRSDKTHHWMSLSPGPVASAWHLGQAVTPLLPRLPSLHESK